MNKWLLTLAVGCILGVTQVGAQDDSTASQQSSTNGDTQTQEPAAASISDATAEKLTELKGKLSGIEEEYLETKGTVNKLAKIKVSGYLQAQLRYAPDTTGQLNPDFTNKYDIGEFQGGKLPAATQSVMQLRRARVKVAYETPLTQMVVQLDCLPFTSASGISSSIQAADTSKKVTTKTGSYLTGGGVTIKDAYLRFTDPWLKSISLKAGVFDRPFGFEISYSSSSRETPERSRLFQTLFPGERDLGFSLEYLPSDNLPLWSQYINFKGGLFAGNGINIEFDDLRDAIGRVGVSIPLTELNLAIDGGFSGYYGSVRNRSDSLYEVKSNVWTGSKVAKWSEETHQYMGGDVELNYGDIPFLGGISVRSEIILGQQPSYKENNGSQKSDQASKDAIYLRNITGYYGCIVLNVDPIKCQIVGKYDVFDPSTDLKDTQVKKIADAKYTTIGAGLTYHWDENIKMIAYYDRVENEKIASAPFDQDVNDDVFTFRIQYKF